MLNWFQYLFLLDNRDLNAPMPVSKLNLIFLSMPPWLSQR